MVLRHQASRQATTTQANRCGPRSARRARCPPHRHQAAATDASSKLGTPTAFRNASDYRAVRLAQSGKSSPALGHQLAIRRVMLTCAVLTACSSCWVPCLDPEHQARHNNTNKCHARPPGFPRPSGTLNSGLTVVALPRGLDDVPKFLDVPAVERSEFQTCHSLRDFAAPLSSGRAATSAHAANSHVSSAPASTRKSSTSSHMPLRLV